MTKFSILTQILAPDLLSSANIPGLLSQLQLLHLDTPCNIVSHLSSYSARTLPSLLPSFSLFVAFFGLFLLTA